MILELANSILHLYARAAELNASRIPQIIYSETVIRYSRVLQLLRASSGVLTRADVRLLVEGSRRMGNGDAVSVTGHPMSATDVASFVHRAMPQPGSEEDIEISDQLRIFAGIASVLSDLGLQRKKGLVLREFVTALLPALVKSRKDNAAELGLHPTASLSPLESAMLDQTHSIAGSLQSFLTMMCEIYGAVQNGSARTTSTANTEANHETTHKITNRILENALRRTYGSPLLKIEILRCCVSICEALPDPGSLLLFSSSLLSTAGSGLAPGPATTDSSPSLPIEDQLRLSANISRSVHAAKQLGLEDAEADYWDDFLVRDIALVSNRSASSTLVPRRKTDLNLANSGAIAETKDGPFIFNPFGAKAPVATKETLLVVNEEVTFVLLLQNLYDMDLEIEWIKFDTEDMAVDAMAKNIVIGPYRTQNVQLLCTPRKAGQLTLAGCIARVKGCRPRRFPLFRTPWRMRDTLKLKRRGVGVTATNTETEAAEPGLPNPTVFEALVIEAQPTLVLQSISLPRSALMILDGETSTFSITLKNVSDTLIDLCLVSLEDSNTEQLRAAVADKDISPADLYEAEILAKSHPALRLLPQATGGELSVPAHSEIMLNVEVFGKPGLVQGAVNLEYCHLGVPLSDAQVRFFTRRLAVPFEITVNSSLGLLYNDILPLPADAIGLGSTYTLASNSGELSDGDAALQFRQMLKQSQSAAPTSQPSHCLMVMDFNNAWSEPIILSLQVRSPESSSSSSPPTCGLSALIQPSRTARFLVPFPKLLLDHPYAQIPSLDPRHRRQFVVSTGDKARPEIERLARELFWYREEAIKHVSATWKVASGSARSANNVAVVRDGHVRRGIVGLRRILVTPRMLESLRQDDLSITLNILGSSSNSLTPSDAPPPSHVTLRSGTFVTAEITLHSRLAYHVRPLLRVQPALRHQPYHVALDVARKVAVNGILQRALPTLAPRETRVVRVGLAFLAPGEYELDALVEEMRILPDAASADNGSGDDDNDEQRARRLSDAADFGLREIAQRSERRVWYTRHACVVDVRAVTQDGG